jgi:uncharacterized membrane protein
MNYAHLHLILNHFPVIGMVIGFCLLGVALIIKSEQLKKIVFGIFVAIALLAIPVYFTGEPAEKIVENLPGVSDTLIETHEEFALFSMIAMEITGLAALIGLFLFHSGRAISGWFTTALFTVSLVTVALMGWTANLGGQIRHTEIRAVAQNAPAMNNAPENKQNDAETKKRHGGKDDD